MIDLIIAYLALIVVVLLLIIVFLTVYIVHERRKSSDQVFKTTEEKKVLVPVFTWRHNVGPSGDHRKLSKRVRCRVTFALSLSLSLRPSLNLLFV